MQSFLTLAHAGHEHMEATSTTGATVPIVQAATAIVTVVIVVSYVLLARRLAGTKKSSD